MSDKPDKGTQKLIWFLDKLAQDVSWSNEGLKTIAEIRRRIEQYEFLKMCNDYNPVIILKTENETLEYLKKKQPPRVIQEAWGVYHGKELRDVELRKVEAEMLAEEYGEKYLGMNVKPVLICEAGVKVEK